MKLKLTVATPLAIVVATDDVTHVRAEDDTDAFGLLPGHADFVTALAVSVVSWRLAAKQPRLPPLHNLAPSLLLQKRVAEYVFALLTEAAVESPASENAARFSAMESAHDNVSRKLEQLRRDARQARQGEITTELIDLVTGAQALQSNPSE